VAISANAIVHNAVAAAGVILLVIATPARWARQAALAAPPTSVPPTASSRSGRAQTE
jgi:hypothetical protein